MADKNDSGNTGLFNSISLDAEIANFAGPSKFPDFSAKENDNNNETKVEDNKIEETNVNDQQQQEQKSEVKSIKDFNKVLGEADTLANKLEDKTKKVEVSKEETEEKEKLEQQTQDNNQRRQRDLTGFNTVEAKWLQRMPFEAYEHFSKVIKQSKELEAKYNTEKKNYEAEIAKAREGKVTIPDSYYEHPQAAYLHPEVQQLQSAVNYSSQIEAHWKQQLINIELGKEWIDLVEDPKTGQIFLANKPSASGEVGTEEWIKNKNQISDYLLSTRQQTTNLQAQLNNHVTSFKQKHEGLVSSIKAAEQKFMPLFNDEKAEEYKQVLEVAKELDKLGIPRTNLVHTMLAKSIAMNLMFVEAFKEQALTKQKQETIQQQQRKAGPTNGAFNGGGAGSGKSDGPNLKDFENFGLPKIKL